MPISTENNHICSKDNSCMAIACFWSSPSNFGEGFASDGILKSKFWFMLALHGRSSRFGRANWKTKADWLSGNCWFYHRLLLLKHSFWRTNAAAAVGRWLLGIYRQILNDVRILQNHGVWVILEHWFWRRDVGLELKLALAERSGTVVADKRFIFVFGWQPEFLTWFLHS